MKKLILPLLLLSFALLACSTKNIELPKPDKEGGIPVMQALNERQTTRDYIDKNLSLQDISDLCWAAWGFNRPEKRTAPSSQNKQEMELYVFLSDGIYKYDAEKHLLEHVLDGDYRVRTGKQDFVEVAGLNFVYVSNLAKSGLESPEEITTESLIASHANSGFMAQNVYLVAASKGLGSVIRGWIDADDVHELLGLSEMHRVLYGQSVGHK